MGAPKLQPSDSETPALLLVGLIHGYLEYLCVRNRVLVRLNDQVRVALGGEGCPEHPNAYALELWCAENPANPSVRVGRILVLYDGDLIFSMRAGIRAWRFAPTDLEACLRTIRLALDLGPS